MEASNAKAMREALLAIKDVAERDMRHHVSMSESDSTSIRAWSNLFVSLASKALSAPSRNCDIGTAEEQYQRYEKFCCRHYRIADNGSGNCLLCPLSQPVCKLAWAQLPYKQEMGEKEGDNDESR